jgi:predicted P-loop ATPase
MYRYLASRYDFQLNEILNVVLASEKKKEEYKVINSSDLYIEARAAGFRASIADINIFMTSSYIKRINPFLDYFSRYEVLYQKEYDGDCIQRFSEYIRVLEQDRFAIQFKKWLVRAIACALEDDTFNKQALIFVQDKQNSGKTTLTHFLVPPDLAQYSAENISTDKDSLIALSENFLIIQDELSTFTRTEINAQKALMSKASVKVRHPYDRKSTKSPRRASILGSTNKAEFLTDETGSVRWLCFNVQEIDWKYKDEVDINKIWSQAYQLYKSGFTYQMTSEEIRENEQFNSRFKTLTAEAELIQRFFSPASKENSDEFLTATEISEELMIETNSKIRITPREIGRAMVLLGFQQVQQRRESCSIPVRGYYIFRNQGATDTTTQ